MNKAVMSKEQKYNYCTLFDSHYLIRGLALYVSMKSTGDPFELYIFALDRQCEDILRKLSLENVTVIGSDEFEDQDLRKIKKKRTVAEYCWTCTSFSIYYVFSNYPVKEVTYLDADLYFFDKPSVLVDEFRDSDRDVLLMEHHYADDSIYKEKLYGRYNVEFMTFRKSTTGMNILTWWKDRCLEWCYARIEEGKFGDQKYLEYFEELFSGTYVCHNIGGGVAPWNVNQYKVSCFDDGKPSVNGKPVIFYHFHELRWYGGATFDAGSGYGKFADDVTNCLYYRYIWTLNECVTKVMDVDQSFRYAHDEKKIVRTSILEDTSLSERCVRKVIKGMNTQEKPIYIWGAGENGKKIYDFFKYYDIQVEGVVDSKYKELSVEDFSVQDPLSIKNRDCFIIVSPFNYRDGIIDKLIEWGYVAHKSYIDIEMLGNEFEKIRGLEI